LFPTIIIKLKNYTFTRRVRMKHKQLNKGKNISLSSLSKKQLQRNRKNEIMKWLKPYLESKADTDASGIWEQLTIHAESKQWAQFGNVIRKKWLNTGKLQEFTTCLDNSAHCRNIWELLNSTGSSTNSGSSSSNTLNSDSSTSTSQSTEVNEGTEKSTISGGSIHNISKKRQQKETLLEWLVPYIQNKSDQDALQMWEEMKILATDGKWQKLGNVIQKKWSSIGYDKEYTKFLSNSHHCRNVWDILIENAVFKKQTGDGGVLGVNT